MPQCGVFGYFSTCRAKLCKMSKSWDKRYHNESGGNMAVRKKKDEAVAICTRCLRNEYDRESVERVRDAALR
jgi:hypothetical protein